MMSPQHLRGLELVSASIGRESLLDTEALTVDKAASAVAEAALVWASDVESGSDWQRRVGALQAAVAWVNRARREQQCEPMGLLDVVDCWERPLSSWLPGAPEITLVEGGVPSGECFEFADGSGVDVLAEVEQEIIGKALSYLASLPCRESAQEVYVEFRRFLIEHPYAQQHVAASMARRVGVELGALYQHLPADSLIEVDGQSAFLPCPRCQYPMAAGPDTVSCSKSRACLKKGARFRRSGSQLSALGRLECPDPVRADGWVVVRYGVWRFTVLPGLEELTLEDRLCAVADVEVELWPELDWFDLRVTRGKRSWRVDVKDHGSASRLAGYLIERPPPEETYIVVPNDKSGQLVVLQTLIPREIEYRFATSAGFVNLVKSQR